MSRAGPESPGRSGAALPLPLPLPIPFPLPLAGDRKREALSAGALLQPIIKGRPAGVVRFLLGCGSGCGTNAGGCDGEGEPPGRRRKLRSVPLGGTGRLASV